MLAQPVLDSRGQLLLPAGARISHESMNGLRLRGIESVMLVDVTDALVEPTHTNAQPLHKKEIDGRLRHLFRPAFEARQLNPLFYLITDYRTKEGK